MNSEIRKLFIEIVPILKQKQDSKTQIIENDLTKIVRVIQHVGFFQDQLLHSNEQEQQNILKKIAQSLNYQQVSENIDIVKYGSYGDLFYLLLNGRCEVLKPKLYFGQQCQNEQKANRQSFGNNNDENTKQNINQSNNDNLYTADIIGPGDSFGEMALIHDKPRTAGIRSITPAYMATLSKKDFKIIFHNIFIEAKLKTEMMQNIFPNIPLSNLIRLSYNFKEKIYTKNQFIYQQDEKPMAIFILKKGQINIIKNIKYNIEEKKQLKNTPIESNEFKALYSRLDATNKQIYRLATVGEGKLFGEEEFLLNQQFRINSAVVETPIVVVYQLDQIHFNHFRVIEGEQEGGIIDELKQKSTTKTQYFDKRKQQIQKIMKNKKEKQEFNLNIPQEEQQISKHFATLVLRSQNKEQQHQQQSNKNSKQAQFIKQLRTIVQEEMQDFKQNKLTDEEKTNPFNQPKRVVDLNAINFMNKKNRVFIKTNKQKNLIRKACFKDPYFNEDFNPKKFRQIRKTEIDIDKLRNPLPYRITPKQQFNNTSKLNLINKFLAQNKFQQITTTLTSPRPESSLSTYTNRFFPNSTPTNQTGQLSRRIFTEESQNGQQQQIQNTLLSDEIINKQVKTDRKMNNCRPKTQQNSKISGEIIFEEDTGSLMKSKNLQSNYFSQNSLITNTQLSITRKQSEPITLNTENESKFYKRGSFQSKQTTHYVYPVSQQNLYLESQFIQSIENCPYNLILRAQSLDDLLENKPNLINKQPIINQEKKFQQKNITNRIKNCQQQNEQQQQDISTQVKFHYKQQSEFPKKQNILIQ